MVLWWEKNCGVIWLEISAWVHAPVQMMALPGPVTTTWRGVWHMTTTETYVMWPHDWLASAVDPCDWQDIIVVHCSSVQNGVVQAGHVVFRGLCSLVAAKLWLHTSYGSYYWATMAETCKYDTDCGRTSAQYGHFPVHGDWKQLWLAERGVKPLLQDHLLHGPRWSGLDPAVPPPPLLWCQPSTFSECECQECMHGYGW